MDKKTIKSKLRTSNSSENNRNRIVEHKKTIDNSHYTKRKISNLVNVNQKVNLDIDKSNKASNSSSLSNSQNKVDVRAPKIPKSVDRAIKNNVKKNLVNSNLERNLKKDITNRKNDEILSTNKNNTSKKNLKGISNQITSPKIPKSVEKAIKNNQGRKISDINIDNARKNLNKTTFDSKKIKGNNTNKTSNNTNLKNKKRKLILTFMTALFICICILLLKLPYFNINSIEIVGTNKYTNEEIIEKSGIVYDENVFIQFFKCNKKNITTLAYIDTVKVSLKLPNKILIKIFQRTPKYFAYDSDNEAFYKLSNDGYVLEKSDINSKTQDELLITGIPFYDSTEIGVKIDEIYMNKILTYELIQSEYDKNNFSGRITKVNFSNSLTTLTINDKLNVVFPNDTELEYKMRLLKSILSELGEDAVGKIDMTKTNPTFSSF